MQNESIDASFKSLTATSDTAREDSIEQLKFKVEHLGEKEKLIKDQIREVMVEEDDFMTSAIYINMDKKLKQIKTELTECKVQLSDLTGDLIENFNSINTSLKSQSLSRNHSSYGTATGKDDAIKNLFNLTLPENMQVSVQPEVNNNCKDNLQVQDKIAVMSSDEDEWQCNFCDFTNDPDDLECQFCNKKRQLKLILRGKDDTDPSIQEEPVVVNQVQRASSERQVSQQMDVQRQHMPNLQLPDITFVNKSGARPKQHVIPNTEPCQHEVSWTCNNCHQQNSYLLGVCLKCKSPKPTVDIEIFENGSGDPGANLGLNPKLANTGKDSGVPVHSFGSRLPGSQKDSKAEEQVLDD